MSMFSLTHNFLLISRILRGVPCCNNNPKWSINTSAQSSNSFAGFVNRDSKMACSSHELPGNFSKAVNKQNGSD